MSSVIEYGDELPPDAWLVGCDEKHRRTFRFLRFEEWNDDIEAFIDVLDKRAVASLVSQMNSPNSDVAWYQQEPLPHVTEYPLVQSDEVVSKEINHVEAKIVENEITDTRDIKVPRVQCVCYVVVRIFVVQHLVEALCSP